MLLIQTLLILALSPQAGLAALTVESEPGALVVWDGVELGRTNSQGRLNISGIPLGDYEIVVSKDGFEASRRRIVVEAGHRSVVFRMLPVMAPVPPDVEPAQVPVRRTIALQAGGSKSAATPVAVAALPSVGVEERKASQVPVAPLEVPWAWFLVPGALLTGLLVWFLRSQSAKSAASFHAVAAAEYRDPFPFVEDPASSGGGSAVSFLDDLRRREVMAEQGLAAPPRDEDVTAIDLDGDDVRTCEEQEDS